MGDTARIELIQHAVWLRRTFVLGKFRSAELQAVDKALKAYELHGGDLTPLRNALKAWQKKAVDWRNSDRNKDGAVAELDRRLQVVPAVQTAMQRDSSHARLGLIYLCGHCRVETGLFNFLISSGLNLVSPINAVAGGSGLIDKAATAGQYIHTAAIAIADRPPSSAVPTIRELWEKLKTYLVNYARDILNDLKVKFADGVGSGLLSMLDEGWDKVVSLINLICGKVAVEAAPFVGGALSLATGLKDTIQASYTRYKSYSLGKNVVLKEGHAAVVVDSLHRAMNFAVGQGIYDALKGAGSIAMSAASFGGSVIVDLVIAGCEAIASLVHRIWETNRMNAFFKDCAQRWQNRNEKSAIHNSPTAFAGWYRSAAVAMPAVSALVLASGMAGDKMQYLEMFNDSATPIAQAEFDRGVVYIDNLKSWSKDYLSDLSYTIKSDDKLISNIIEASSTTKFKPLTVINGPLLRWGGPTGGAIPP